MWICNRCQTKNREGETRCIQCSAPRSARRFGAGTVVETPSVTGAPVKQEQEIRSPQVHTAPMQRAAAPQAEKKPASRPRPKRPGNGAARWLSALGIILALLLPALLIYLAISHYAALSPQLNSLLFPAPAVQLTVSTVQTPSPALGLAVYTLATALAAMLCMLPGLYAMGLGRLLIRLTPSQSRHY
jgi:hypothetical protein